MELLRSKSNGIGFMQTLLAVSANRYSHTAQHATGIRYTTFRSALATLGGSLNAEELVPANQHREHRREQEARANHSSAAAAASTSAG